MTEHTFQLKNHKKRKLVWKTEDGRLNGLVWRYVGRTDGACFTALCAAKSPKDMSAPGSLEHRLK